MAAIPLTVIGGFLGSGKTTLINRLLTDPGQERTAVLVNDFGALNIDAGLIRSASGDVIEFANGCVCCTIGDSLVETLFTLFERPALPGRILIEASGVADPARIGEIAQLDDRLVLDGVVVLIDAERFLKQMADDRLEDTLERQVASADLFIVNKCDAAGADRVAKVRVRLDSMQPGAPVLEAVEANVPPEMLFGMARPPRSGHDHHHPEHPFWTRSLERDGSFDRTRLEALFDEIAEAGVIRAKGVFRLTGDEDHAWVFQLVDGTWRFDPARGPGLPETSRLVLIGQGEGPADGYWELRVKRCG